MQEICLFLTVLVALTLAPSIPEDIQCTVRSLPPGTIFQLRCLWDTMPALDSVKSIMIYHWPTSAPDGGDSILQCKRMKTIENVFNCTLPQFPYQWTHSQKFCLVEVMDPNNCLTVTVNSTTDTLGDYACKLIPEARESKKCSHRNNNEGVSALSFSRQMPSEPGTLSSVSDSATQKHPVSDDDSKTSPVIRSDVIILGAIIFILAIIIMCFVCKRKRLCQKCDIRLGKHCNKDTRNVQESAKPPEKHVPTRHTTMESETSSLLWSSSTIDQEFTDNEKHATHVQENITVERGTQEGLCKKYRMVDVHTSSVSSDKPLAETNVEITDGKAVFSNNNECEHIAPAETNIQSYEQASIIPEGDYARPRSSVCAVEAQSDDYSSEGFLDDKNCVWIEEAVKILSKDSYGTTWIEVEKHANEINGILNKLAKYIATLEASEEMIKRQVLCLKILSNMAELRYEQLLEKKKEIRKTNDSNKRIDDLLQQFNLEYSQLKWKTKTAPATAAMQMDNHKTVLKLRKHLATTAMEMPDTDVHKHSRIDNFGLGTRSTTRLPLMAVDSESKEDITFDILRSGEPQGTPSIEGDRQIHKSTIGLFSTGEQQYPKVIMTESVPREASDSSSSNHHLASQLDCDPAYSVRD